MFFITLTLDKFKVFVIQAVCERVAGIFPLSILKVHNLILLTTIRELCTNDFGEKTMSDKQCQPPCEHKVKDGDTEQICQKILPENAKSSTWRKVQDFLLESDEKLIGKEL